MNFKYDKDKNIIEIQLEKFGRTKRQKYLIAKKLEKQEINHLLKYMETFAGNRHKFNLHEISKPARYAEDRLAEKSKNRYVKMFNQLLDSTRTHVPFDTERGLLEINNGDWIGVEIECFIPYDSLGIEIPETKECSRCEGSGTLTQERWNDDDECHEEYEAECGDCDGRGHFDNDECDKNEFAIEHLQTMFRSRKLKRVCVKDDGSIDPESGYFTTEIVVLTKLSDSSNLLQVCNFLKELGAKVNTSCGLHVHLDARHLDVTQVELVGNKFKKALPVLINMVPESRRNNKYCKLKVSDIDESGNSNERYSAINLTSYYKHNTIEIRLHSGTTDYQKIMNWAMLLKAISVSDIKKTCKDINMLTDYVDISQDLLEYIGQRTALFSKEQDVTSKVALDLDDTESEHEDLIEVIENHITTQRIEEYRVAINNFYSISSNYVIDIETEEIGA